MFASQVAAYNADRLVDGAPAAGDHFKTDGALYKAISAMARLRAAEPALRAAPGRAAPPATSRACSRSRG
jgi:hypothetical protein